MNDKEKDAIYLEVADFFDQHIGKEKRMHDSLGTCLYWARVGALVLKRHGIHAMPESGTMNWPMVNPEDDDGISPTHFTYEWSPWREESKAAMSIGILPEIHIWLVTEDENIIDFSTGSFKRIAEHMGLRWTAPPPPTYLWTPPGIPGARYMAKRGAMTWLARWLLMKQQQRVCILNN